MGSLLICSDLSSPQWFNMSLSRDPSLLLLHSLQLPFANLSGCLPRELGSLLNFDPSKFSAEVVQGNSPGLSGLPLKSCAKSSSLSAGVIGGIMIGLLAGAVVIASLLIGRKRKSMDHDEEEMEEGEDDKNGKVDGGGGKGKLIVFQRGEHLTLEDVLNATGQVMEKTSYGSIYKAKLVDCGANALRLLIEGSCKEKWPCLPLIKQLGRIRHENFIPLHAFCQGRRGDPCTGADLRKILIVLHHFLCVLLILTSPVLATGQCASS
uniref:Uncharacterized protein n=1 Tax=Kalanchoe fedtschenkoi TaxID=63787 RepID=A0A7N0VC04_KALFE